MQGLHCELASHDRCEKWHAWASSKHMPLASEATFMAVVLEVSKDMTAVRTLTFMD
jgi:hypothetical protein